MHADNRKVSVLVPLYNCAPYLSQCLDSLLLQTYEDIEILISDDASTDNSAEIAAAYALKDARVKLFRQPQNLGLLDNYNFLFQKATGQFIAIQDSDDWTSPDRIEKQIKVLQAHPGVALVGTQAAIHYPDGRVALPEAEQSGLVNGIEDDFPSVPASVLFRRELLQKVPAMHPYFKGGTSMDRYFIMELLEGTKGWHIAEPLYHARTHAASNHRTFNLHKMFTTILFYELIAQRRQTGTDWVKQGNVAAIKNWEKTILGNRKLMARQYRDYAVFQIDGGNLQLARTYLWKSMRLNPVAPLLWASVKYWLKRCIKS